ncbi:MAG: zf-HC2 domain-containing protein [Steroidobacteraceae bacterium]|nr:zf-HC2 domain-containing protein [Steroidobacteraceae bacterium]
MLLPITRDRRRVALAKKAPPGPCGYERFITGYTARARSPVTRAVFERHLLECAACLRSVQIRRMTGGLTSHNSNSGIACAATHTGGIDQCSS